MPGHLFTLLSLALAVTSSAYAAPALKLTGCDLSKTTLTLPSTAAAAGLSVPAGQTLEFVGLGRGVQNYTCTSGTYQKNMAVATLYDASCAVNSPIFKTLTTLDLAAPNPATLPPVITALIGNLKLGDHYFQNLTPNATSANPVFDFRATGKGDFIAAAKKGSVPDPTNSTKDVAWLELTNVQGSLANTVFRVQTAGGMPPTSCTTEGRMTTVQYSALYYFYK